MGLRSWLSWLGRGSRATAEFAATPRPIDQLFAELRGVGDSPRVSRVEALSVPAVLRGRNMICAVATLPLVQVDATNNVVRSSFLSQIDPDIADVVTLAQTFEDLVLEGIAWWRITAFGFDTFPLAARRLDPSTVSLYPPDGYRSRAPLPAGQDPRGATVWIDGEPVPADQVIRFDSPNPGVLATAGRAIRRAILLERAARMYAEDPRPLDYFSPTEGADTASDTEIKEILGEWREARRKRATGYVPAALKYNTVDSPTPADMQLAELKKQATLDIANALGVDPEDLGVSTTSRTYANAVDRRRDRINDVLAPFMRAVTDRLSMGDVTKRGYKVVFDLAVYLQSNPTERWNVYQIAKTIGALDVDEIRAKEGEPARDLVDHPVDQAAPSTVVASVTPIRRSQSDAAVPWNFSSPHHQFTFAGDAIGFSVDTGKRTITGLAVPYGKIGVKYGLQFRFRKGSLQYNEISRVKHFKDHVTPVGKALDLKDTRAGLMATLSVGSGPTGDELLQLAADGVYDGLSVGVDFNMDPGAGDVVLARDGVYDVIRGDLREISTTAMPAFDDARVTKVAASLTAGGLSMLCATCGQEHAPNVACVPQQQNQPAAPAQPGGVQLSNEQLGAILNAAPHGVLAALLGHNAPGAQEAAPVVIPEQRQPVDPTRLTASATVTEELPYRFDRKGNLTRGVQYDFSTDLISGLKDRDGEALERAEAFMRAQFVNVADAATLNPNKQRPDLYVDQKDFTYPIWSTIDKGTLADQTPFVLPKFNSSGGLVAAHVENTEPTPGTFNATSQTITPSAVSGKVEISREAWDQGGNPQLSGLVWTQMTRAWFEALEASAVALLEAAAPTTLTITTAAADAALEASITSQLAPLQFVRGGFRMRDAFAQVDLYKALIAAKDTAGRKLFPIIGAQNATGTTSEFFSSVLVAGLVFRPAWGLAATSINSANSYLLDRGDVSGWATAPQRLTFDNISIAKIHLGIWGYKALAITDLTGIRRLAYDPV